MLLLINLPPTDPAPLADYLPYLNLLRELLREHADQILPHPITISVKPEDLVLLKDLYPLHWDFSGPTLIWSFSQHPLLSSCPVAAPLKEQTLGATFHSGSPGQCPS
jgi:hypothetical protein